MFASTSTQAPPLSVENGGGGGGGGGGGLLRLLGEDYDTSESVGLATLPPPPTSSSGASGGSGRFVVLKRNGSLQVWSGKQKKIVSRLHLAEQVCCLSLSLSLSLSLML
jgi:hypothetical protein